MNIRVYISIPRGNIDWGTDHHNCYEDDMLRYLVKFIHHQVLAQPAIGNR